MHFVMGSTSAYSLAVESVGLDPPKKVPKYIYWGQYIVRNAMHSSECY